MNAFRLNISKIIDRTWIPMTTRTTIFWGSLRISPVHTRCVTEHRSSQHQFDAIAKMQLLQRMQPSWWTTQPIHNLSLQFVCEHDWPTHRQRAPKFGTDLFVLHYSSIEWTLFSRLARTRLIVLVFALRCLTSYLIVNSLQKHFREGTKTFYMAK